MSYFIFPGADINFGTLIGKAKGGFLDHDGPTPEANRFEQDLPLSKDM